MPALGPSGLRRFPVSACLEKEAYASLLSRCVLRINAKGSRVFDPGIYEPYCESCRWIDMSNILSSGSLPRGEHLLPQLVVVVAGILITVS